MKFERTDVQTLTAEQFAEQFGECPVDKNDPENSMTAVYFSVPTAFSAKAKATMDYFDDSAFIFEYKDHLVVTDESLYLTMHGNGTYEAPSGCPRAGFDSWEDLESWLERVYQDLVDDGIIEAIG